MQKVFVIGHNIGATCRALQLAAENQPGVIICTLDKTEHIIREIEPVKIGEPIKLIQADLTMDAYRKSKHHNARTLSLRQIKSKRKMQKLSRKRNRK